MQIAEVTNRLNEPELASVLALAVGDATTQKLAAIAREYERDPSRTALALTEDELTIAIVTLEIGSPGCAKLRYISVRPSAQRSGMGRRLLAEAFSRNHLREVSAESDGDTVGFYIACGFRAVSLGELYPGVERFECTWRAG